MNTNIDELTDKVIQLLSPLTHTDRDDVLRMVIELRGHWFVRQTVAIAIRDLGPNGLTTVTVKR